MKFKIPSEVEYIINKFYKNGYEAYIVGGSIRDLLLDKSPKDFDIATSAPPEVTQILFKKSFPTGIKHGTITVVINNENYEVTTFRTDGTYINNRKPKEVHFITNVKDDLSRRDFTINAFAYNSKTGLLDYFNGINDLNNKIIKTVGEGNLRFQEDALRMLRGIRFSSQLDFSIDIDTLNAIYNNKHLIKNISKERIQQELIKLLECNNSFKGLQLLNRLSIFPIIFGKENINLNINININNCLKDIPIRLSFLFYKLNINDVYCILKNLKFSNNNINNTLLYLENISLLTPQSTNINLKKLISKIGKENIFKLIHLYEIINNTSLETQRNICSDIIKTNTPVLIKDLNINGRILKDNIENIPGEKIGILLKHLIEEVINENIKNTEESLLNESKRFLKIHLN